MSTNEHKAGYKKTKLGWIPEEWKQFRIKEILKDYKLGGNYNGVDNSNGLPLIKMGNISRGSINLERLEYIDEDSISDLEHLLKYGDVLFNTRNSLSLVGKVAIWKSQKDEAAYNSNILKLSPKEDVIYSNEFLNYLLNVSYVIRKFRSIATGTTSVAAIYTKDLLRVKVEIPSKPEQQKIAEILATWDTAIQKLDQLIKAKEKQKKALMQQLLSGKNRFAEFEAEEWKEVKLGSLVSRIERKVEKPDDEYLSIGIRSHGLGTFQKPDKDPDDNSMTHLYQVEEDDLIVNITFAWEGAIAVVKKEDDGGYVSHRFPTFVFKRKKLLPEYFKYVIIQPRMFYLLGVISPGGAGRNRVLNKKDFVNLKIDLPSIEEQKKIGAFLTKADNEIEGLEQLLKKYEAQKKGLMQQLLTGQTRVTHLLSDQPKKAAS